MTNLLLTPRADQPTENPNATPSVPQDLKLPAVMMFCEGLQEGEQRGAGSPIARVSDAASVVVYKPDSCEPDIDDQGRIAVRQPDGSTGRVVPTYTTDPAPWSNDDIVWTPARGELNGKPTVMTASFLQHDAQTGPDSLGAVILEMNITAEGRQVFGSLTERLSTPDHNRGLPLAIFIGGVPLRDTYGGVIAPRVRSKITEAIWITSLLTRDARRIVEPAQQRRPALVLKRASVRT